MDKELLESQKRIAREYMASIDPEGECTYHNWRHVSFVYQSAMDILKEIDLPAEHKEDILLACMWHDVDFANGAEDHEERSSKIARKHLEEAGLSEERLDRIHRLIMVTKDGAQPSSLDESVVRDADIAHLASENYLSFYHDLYDELTDHQGKKISKEEWRQMCVVFMTAATYQTDIATELYAEGLNENLAYLQDKLQMEMEEQKRLKALKKKKKKLKKKRKKAAKPNYRIDKGIETMWKVSLRNHIHISRIADDKANTLISVNAIILSIVLTALFPRIDSNPSMFWPGVCLSLVSIATIVLATLSTMPKTSHGLVSKEDVEKKRGNLIFFGNFHAMQQDVYEWSMQQVMDDPDYLYRTLTRDLYYLGKVLNKKYKLLRYAYTVFVIGLIMSIVIFVKNVPEAVPENVPEIEIGVDMNPEE